MAKPLYLLTSLTSLGCRSTLLDDGYTWGPRRGCTSGKRNEGIGIEGMLILHKWCVIVRCDSDSRMRAASEIAIGKLESLLPLPRAVLVLRCVWGPRDRVDFLLEE